MSPSATGLKSVWSSIVSLRELEGRRAGDHVAPHPSLLVELGDAEERADPLAGLVHPGLAERELDVALRAAPQDVVRPAGGVARVGEAAQLLHAAEELAAPAVRRRGPL